LNTSEQRDIPVIVSLTTYPARLPYVYTCLKSILRQTYKPDQIILYMGDDVDADQIGKDIKSLEKHGLTIARRSERQNLKPHKKYYYAMQEYPDAIVVTIDDDSIYDRNLLRTLAESYRRFPNAVSAKRVRRMAKANDKLLPYAQWEQGSKRYAEPSMGLIAIGVGGVLYPPHCMDPRIFNIEEIFELCVNADDIWLKFMQILKQTPVVHAAGPDCTGIKGTEKSALHNRNLGGGMNDLYIENMQKHFNIYLKDCIPESDI
jgi:glycosyltransferase involved in cell wall biosynthesis